MTSTPSVLNLDSIDLGNICQKVNSSNACIQRDGGTLTTLILQREELCGDQRVIWAGSAATNPLYPDGGVMTPTCETCPDPFVSGEWAILDSFGTRVISSETALVETFATPEGARFQTKIYRPVDDDDWELRVTQLSPFEYYVWAGATDGSRQMSAGAHVVTDGVGCLEDFMDTAEKAPLTQLLLNEDYCDSNNGCSWQDHCENSEVCNWEGVENRYG